jgi:hypothetical protein
MNAAMMLATGIDPSLLLDTLGFADALDWQRQLLRSTAPKILLNAHRQAGKSTATAALGIWTALDQPGALVLVVSASQRQSNELFRKVSWFYRLIGSPVPLVEDSATTLALATGSRVVSLPDSSDTIVGYSGPRLIIVDEAARTSDETYRAITPMLLRSRGRLVALSTPRGQRGWWYEAWHATDAKWERIEFPVAANPAVDPDWLAEERLMLGPLWAAQEFDCQFVASDQQFFTVESIDSAFDSELEPLFS